MLAYCTEMSLLLRSLILIIFGISLAGCSHVFKSAPTHAFRNRNFDYTESSDTNLYPPQSPPGLPTPDFAPNLIIPPGQNYYPPDPNVLMTPPGFVDVYPIPALPNHSAPAK